MHVGKLLLTEPTDFLLAPHTHESNKIIRNIISNSDHKESRVGVFMKSDKVFSY